MPEEYALIKSRMAAMYVKPDVNSERADEVLHGMKVKILEREGSWLLCETHYSYRGYIRECDLTVHNIEEWDKAGKCLVYNESADVLSEGRIQSAVLDTMVRGAQLRLLGSADEKGFISVGLADGRTGYIKEKFVGPFVDSMYEDSYAGWCKKSGRQDMREFLHEHYDMSEEQFREQVATTALLYMGTQYRWGGKTPEGIDCSGLCSMAYMMNGVVIYRDAKIQENFPVKRIEQGKLRIGDLMYFNGHIAMYLNDGAFIHATGKNGSDGVVVSSMIRDSEDYREDLDGSMLAAGSLFADTEGTD